MSLLLRHPLELSQLALRVVPVAGVAIVVSLLVAAPRAGTSFGQGAKHSQTTTAEHPQVSRIVFRVASTARVTGPGRSATSHLFELDAWVAWDDSPRFEGASGESGRGGSLGPIVPRVVGDLVRAYRAGDIEAVLALYDERSQADTRVRLADSKFKSDWLAGIRQVVSLSPLVLWREGEGFVCVLRQETRDPTGEIHPGLTALKLDSALKLQSGKLDSDAFVQLSNGLADPKRRPSDLLANLDYLRKRFEERPR